MNDQALRNAYKYCEEVTRLHAKSFYFAAKFLPRHKQIPVFAVYAFCRHVDDEIDDSGYETEEQAAQAVAEWRSRLDSVYGASDPAVELPQKEKDEDSLTRRRALDDVFLAWRDMLGTYPIPQKIPLDLIKGVLMDTYKKRYGTFDELYVYCYHVASTVGLMSSEILGYSRPVALQYAEKMGVAMQLTNILRDVREDAEMGRIYLPAEDLERFGVTEEQIFGNMVDGNFRRLMEFEIDRARELYREGEKGVALLEPDTRFTVLFASRIYSRILVEIEALSYDVFSSRAHTTKAQKLFAMPRIWFESKKLRAESLAAE